MTLRPIGLLLATLAPWITPVLSPLQAQTPDREPAVAEISPGARALGLGLAPQLGSADPDLAFVHPSLARGLSGMRLGYDRYGDGGTGHSLSAATSWLGGGVALSLRALEFAGGDPGSRPGGLDPLVSEAGEGVAETVATVTYARSVLGLDLGVSGRVSTQRLDAESVTAGMVDVGVSRELGPLRVALTARNLGPTPELASQPLELPTSVVLGAGAYGRPLGPVDVGAAAQVVRRDDGTFVVGGGLEVGYWPVVGRTFVGRIGLRNVPEGEALPVTFGGSFWGDALVVDYAFQAVDGGDGIHRITLGWR